MESVSILLPADRLPVLLYDSPHSGRYYPADFETRATGAVLRRSEDAYVDDLILPALTCGAAVVVANYPRSYIDVNREPDDIDVALLAEPWPGPLRPSDKSQKGLGLIRRFVTPGVEVHAQPLTVSEVCRRIETVYEPYHRQLGALINRIRRDRGFVWHINWHSMKSVGHAMAPDGEGARRADVVVGDLDGRSASPDLTGFIVDALQSFGYRVAVNHPYKGGTIVQRYANPARGIHVVQIELNRALYMDEATIARTDGFTGLQANLLALSQRLADASTQLSAARGASR